jgi:hypothetical protein
VAEAPARRRLHTTPDEVEVRERPRKLPEGGRRPAWVTDDLVAEEQAHSQRLATRRGRAGLRARSSAKSAAGKAGASYGRTRPRGGGTSFTPPRISAGGPTGLRLSGGRVTTDAAGFVLAIFTWCWVLLPALRGGPDGVRDTLRAKFFNKSPDGSWLP